MNGRSSKTHISGIIIIIIIIIFLDYDLKQLYTDSF